MSRAYAELILGGARSGKSTHAQRRVEQLAQQSALNKRYIATATPLDEEMSNRIRMHQADRDRTWQLLEEPRHLSSALMSASTSDCVLIDCLTLWLNNCLFHGDWQQQRAAFLTALQETPAAAVVMVSNEVGQGVVPANALARQFVDESGWLHQELGALCDSVSIIVAGFSQVLKS